LDKDFTQPTFEQGGRTYSSLHRYGMLFNYHCTAMKQIAAKGKSNAASESKNKLSLLNNTANSSPNDITVSCDGTWHH